MPVKFEAIKPQFYDVEAIAEAAEKSARKVGEGMLDDFEQTTSTWKHKPAFTILEVRSGGVITVGVGTDDEIYRYVTKGTKAHTIHPRRRRVLSFRTGYKAKTTPRKLRSGGGGASGPRRFARRVKHPGTKAREFEEEITKKWKRPSVRLIQQAIERSLGIRR
jgi:hypothetical protein